MDLDMALDELLKKSGIVSDKKPGYDAEIEKGIDLFATHRQFHIALCSYEAVYQLGEGAYEIKEIRREMPLSDILGSSQGIFIGVVATGLVCWPGEFGYRETRFDSHNVRSLTGARLPWGGVSIENGYFCLPNNPAYFAGTGQGFVLRDVQKGYYFAKGLEAQLKQNTD